MPLIRLETYINAPIKRCFDLSLSVDLHRHSVADTHERPVAGVNSGGMKLGDTVTWEAIHFGIKGNDASQPQQDERGGHEERKADEQPTRKPRRHVSQQ